MNISMEQLMQDNLIICNNTCNANCVHCPFSTSSKDVSSLSNFVFDIYLIESELIILSGGEPFELPFILFAKYVAMCVACRKYFRIATGGHVDVKPYLHYLKKNPFFTGLQLGTDVISQVRNSFYKKHVYTWLQNIEYLKQNNLSYNLTITLSKDFNLKEILNIIKHTVPSFILVNSYNIMEEILASKIKLINLYFPKCEIKYGYKDSALPELL